MPAANNHYFDISAHPATLGLRGGWTSAHATQIAEESKGIAFSGDVLIDAGGLNGFDTSGAWLLTSLIARAQKQGVKVSLQNLHKEHLALFRLVADTPIETPDPPKHKSALTLLLEHVGIASITFWQSMLDLFRFIGETSVTLAHVLRHPSRLRLNAIARHIEETGLDASPIIALIAFLISIVLAYQGATQLRLFGAEIFTVDLVTVSVLREMGVLLTAILVAGRSGSAFTAEIGVMKVNEEVDAMRVIGLNPFEVLVLPRLIALLITLPILTFIADIMGLIGAAIMSMVVLDIPLVQSIDRIHIMASRTHFWVGLMKAPAFAFLIGIVGCMRGMQVTGSAESVGRLTTISVVQSIFLVLLADALFSILFTKLGI